MKTMWLLGSFIGIVLMLGSVVTAQDDRPPPLGYGLDSEHYERYYVYDFESQKSTEIHSKIPSMYTGNSEPLIEATPIPRPQEIYIQSPLDPNVRFVLILQKDQERLMYPKYDLYRIAADSSRELVALKASVPSWSEYWSPNGRYLYFRTQSIVRREWFLQQYDIERHQLKAMGGKFEYLDDCRTDSAWCVVDAVLIPGAYDSPSTSYLLNRDDGSLRELARSPSSGVRAIWLEQGQAIVYSNIERENKLDIYYYNIPAAKKTLLAELDAQAGVVYSTSPDERWVIVGANLGTDQPHSLLVIDRQNLTPKPTLLTGYNAYFSYSTDTPHWVDADTFVYMTYQERKDSVIYRIDFPEGRPVEIARFKLSSNFYDHMWSPNGRWLAISTSYSNENASSRGIYVISIEGEIRKLPLTLPAEGGICVGWFSEAAYASGKANICDVYLGEG